MKQEEILEYNKRCADFLGYCNPIIDKDFYFVEHKDYNINSSIPKLLELNFEKRFHSDWNWIMEVCISIGMEFVTTNKEQLIQQIYDKLRSMETNS